MYAKNVTGFGTGGKRKKLVDQLPLQTPFAIDLFPIYACNFQCEYCIFSLPKNQRKEYQYKNNVMDFSLFEKICIDLQDFEDKIEMFRFVGNGEPLLHPRIVDMVRLVVETQKCKKVEIITNGSLLTPELSDALVDAGLTQMRISLQGLDKLSYVQHSKAEIDFEEFLKNIEYLFYNRGDMKLNLKIPDYVVDTEDKWNNFMSLFGNIADSIAVERISPIASKVDYSKFKFEKNKNVISTREEELPVNLRICSHPFYLMMVNPDGSVFPCCTFELPPSMGTCKEDSLFHIWNGAKFNDFRVKMLGGGEMLRRYM